MKLIPGALVVVTLLCLPRQGEAQEIAAAQPPGRELTVTASFAERSSVTRHEPIALHLNRPLQPEEGKLAVLVGATDVTNLFTATAEALSYAPDALPLPTGDTELTVYLVSSHNEWREIARFPLRVLAKRGFERAAVIPALNLSNKSQVAEGHFPDAFRPPRVTYQDFTSQVNLQTEHVRSRSSVRSQWSVVGTSYRKEALRYGEKGEKAPPIDLSGYLLQVQESGLQVSLGHVSHGRQRHLISGYGSRGALLSATLSGRADLSFAAVNGTGIVGWENFLGLKERDHRILSGTFGVEALPRRPGALRLEASYVDGSLLPRNPFNQATINDAEKSRGVGLRLVASTMGQRIQVEGGFARSRFTNPPDPFLAQGTEVVPVKETARNARYWDLTLGVLRNVSLSPNLPANVTIHHRHERVDPLYRSVTAYVRPDFVENAFEVQSNVGVVTTQFSHNRSEDNLDEIPSILKTKTRGNAFNLGLPLASLFGTVAGPRRWLPLATYSYDRTHQFGATLPTHGGFSRAHVPDQVNHIHTATLDWQAARWRFGYRFSYALQDNRQESREKADFVNRTSTLSLGLIPFGTLNLNVDVAFEGAENKEINRSDHTQRYGLNLSLQTTKSSALNVNLSTTLSGDDAKTSERQNSVVNLEWSLGFGFGRGERKLLKGQLFLRYAWQEGRSEDRIFGFADSTKNWSVNTGVNLSVF